MGGARKVIHEFYPVLGHECFSNAAQQIQHPPFYVIIVSVLETHPGMVDLTDSFQPNIQSGRHFDSADLIFGQPLPAMSKLISFKLLPPATKLGQGYVFTGVCDSVNRGGACVVPRGGRAWFYSGGGMHGFIRGGRAWFYSGGACVVLFGGACVVLFGGVACMVLFGGGMRGFIRGACVVLFRGGVRGFIQGGVRGFIQGGHAWFCSEGGRAWFYWEGGACVVLFRGGVRGFSSFCGYNEIRSMSGRYASYWNAFLFSNVKTFSC